MCFQISLRKFHKNSLSERLLEEKTVTQRDELTEHKAVSQKTSFHFVTEVVSFFTIAPYGLPNISLQIPQEQSQRKASWGESCNSVRWINRTQSSFSESFIPVFNGRYFHFHHSPLWASKYHFPLMNPFAKTVLVEFSKWYLEAQRGLWWKSKYPKMKTEKKFSEKLLCVLLIHLTELQLSPQEDTP